MKKYLRVLLFAVLVAALFVVTAVAASAANPFSTGGNTYATLPEAVTAVSAGGTITMTESATFSGDIVLDVDKTYTLTASSSSVTLTLTDGSLRINAGTVTLQTLKLDAKANNALMVHGASTGVTILSGTFVSEGATTATAGAAVVDKSAYLQIDSGSFTGSVGTYDDSVGSVGGTSAERTRLVINGGTFTHGKNLSSGQTAYVLRLARQYTTVEVNGGTFDYNAAQTANNNGGYAVYFNTATGVLTINDGTFTAQGKNLSNVIEIRGGSMTVNGGRYYILTEAAYTLNATNAANVTITGGFFTFMDTWEGPEDVDPAFPQAPPYPTNSLGLQCCYGARFDSTGTLSISGGTFMGGYAHQALTIGANATKAVITGGSFYGYRAVNLQGQAVFNGGNFYNNPGHPNAKIIDIRSANAVAYIFDGNFDGTHVTASNIGTGAVIFFASAGKVSIYGGTFKLGGTNESGAIIGLDVAGTVEIKSGSLSVNGTSYTGSGASFVKTGSGFVIRAAASGNIQIDAGSFVAKNNAIIVNIKAGTQVKVKGGTFDVYNSAIAFQVTDENATLSFPILGKAAVTTYDRAIGLSLSGGDTTITGGTFVSNSACIVNFAIPEGKGSLKIVRGTFILNDSDTIKGGAIIRAGVVVIPQNKGQYYDPTEMYLTASAEIQLNGGTLIDNRNGNSQVIDITVGQARVTVNGALLLSRYLKGYFVDANEPYGTDVRMTPDSVVCQYGGQNYYCYFAKANTTTTYSPVMNEQAGVSVTEDYEGIRFTAVISAAIAATLPEGATYGTLIAPADYVAAAGAFTHAKLNSLLTNNPAYGTTYVDIPAKYSIVTLPDGSIAFSGTLINLKTANYTRALAAVAYVKVGSTYYYSDYDAAYNTDSMAAVTKAAYTSYVILPDEEHMSPSLYYHNGYSAFDETEQEILKSYCGYEHTYDVSTVTPSTTITVGSDASANLKTAADTALKNKLTSLGYTASGAAILVGNTGTTETAKALSEIEGEGYYIGVINGKIVIVGTTNALTMQALSVFSNTVLADMEANKTVIISEIISSHVEMLPLNSDTPFVFSWHRDGNIWQPYTGGGERVYANFAFLYKSTAHLYNKEGNEQFYVDYPVVAAILLGNQLDGSGFNFTYVPDNLASNRGTIQIGLTDYAMQTALMGHDAGYYGYQIKDGSVVITAFDDSTLRLAKKLFEDDLVDFATDDGYFVPADYEFEKHGTDGFTGGFDSLPNATGSGNVAEEVKKLVTDTTLCPRPANIQLSGVVNVHNDAIEYYYENAGFGDYYSYCRLLESKGFTVYMAQRTVENSYFVTYVNKTTGVMLHVMLHAYAHAAEQELTADSTLAKMFTPTLRVIAAKTTNDQEFVQHLLDESMLRLPATGKKTVTKLTSMEVSFDLNDDTKRNFGFCYVYTLEDGTFVVLDGGGGGHNATDAARLYNLLTDLYKDAHGGTAPTNANPIEITWLLSHGHGDHYGMMDKFFSSYCAPSSSKAKVTKLIANTPSNDEMYNSMDPNPNVGNYIESGNWYVNGDGTYMQYYKVHTGQKFFIGNLEVEVMYTHEDIHPWGMIYYNNTSTVLRLTAHETDGNGNILFGKNAISLMDLGDLQVRGSQVIRAMWGDYLKSDMVLSAHHGGNGIEGLAYELIDAQIILWSHSSNSVQGIVNRTSTTAYVLQNLYWLENTRWLYIFIGQPLDETPANDYQYNPTMTLTKDGIAGLPLDVCQGNTPLTDDQLQTYADQFIAGLTNEYNGSAGTTFGWGTGIFNKELDGAEPTYVGGTNNNGIILWRGNFKFVLPDPVPLPEDDSTNDTAEDILGDDMIEF